jgi:hypothetical protein
VQFFLLLGLVQTALRKADKADPAWFIVNSILQGTMLIQSIFSRFKLKLVYHLVITLQVRCFTAFIQKNAIFKTGEDPEFLANYTLVLFISCIMNQTMISHLLINHKTKLNVFMLFSINVGLIHRVYGFENAAEHLGKILMTSCQIVIIVPFYIFINQSLLNLNLQILIEANKSQKEM